MIEGKADRRTSMKSRRKSRKSMRDSFARRLSTQSDQADGASRGRRGSDASSKSTPGTARRIQKIKALIGSPPVFAAAPVLNIPKPQEVRGASGSIRGSSHAPVKYKQAKPHQRKASRDEEPGTPRVQKKVEKISREKAAMPRKRAHREGA